MSYTNAMCIICTNWSQLKILTLSLCLTQEVQVVSTHLSKHSPHHHLRNVPLLRGCAQGCRRKVSCALGLCVGLRRRCVQYWHQSGSAGAQVRYDVLISSREVLWSVTCSSKYLVVLLCTGIVERWRRTSPWWRWSSRNRRRVTGPAVRRMMLSLLWTARARGFYITRKHKGWRGYSSPW